MNKKIKNIIMIVIIIIVGILSFFTMNAASTTSIKQEIGGMQGGQEGLMEPGENGDMTLPEGTGNNGETPPDLPEENGDMTMPEDAGDNGETPPDLPEENSDMAMPEDAGNNGETPPDLPEENSDMTLQGEPGENNGMLLPEEQSGNTQTIKTLYYAIFAIEGFVISALIIYLIMSNFNKKTLKETLNSARKIVIYIVLLIVLTAGLTFLQVYLTDNIFINADENQMQNNNMQKPEDNMNSSSGNITYTATEEITEDTTINSGNYFSNTADENAILVSGNIDVTLSNISVEKQGDSAGGDDSNFYGNNSAILAKDGANLTLENISVITNATGANGVFSYGGSATTNNSSSDGTTVTITNSEITTTGDNAGGIMTTGGGNTIASNLTINTSGTSSAAIRTDRGGGTVTVDGGTYTTTGAGSPAIYSTADITVNNATLVSKASEGIVIEGANSVTINNCDLTDSNTKLNGQSTTYKNIFLYQSMSGDASNGTAEFTANDCTITTNNGDSFYITNTTATINLTNNIIINNDTTGNFLRAAADSWGNSGSNGGDVTLIMNNQEAIGNIAIDSISTLDMSMQTDSYYEGTINADNSAKSITLKLDASSKIKLTGDSYVTLLEDSDTSYSNIDFNGYKLYVNGIAIN